ncbi:MAG: 4Fe-4S ferredoxin [Bacteroidales bacterium]|nr:4Fe-4S ferredoxin [Bacteroidales bacterium]
MKREIVRIDRELCNGCGECIPNCHEGALQLIDGKATLISDLLCDGLGACIGHCPIGAISIEERDAVAYDEVAALQEIIRQGKNVLIAHLKHLQDHKQDLYMKEAEIYLRANQANFPFEVEAIWEALRPAAAKPAFHLQVKPAVHHGGSSCPGSQAISFNKAPVAVPENGFKPASELRQWPVQMHLINPNASYFKKSDLLLAADCVAFAMGDFHQTWLKNKSLVIACPKLDSGMDSYIEKLIQLIQLAEVNTITVLKMQVPCCGGLVQMVKTALQYCDRKVPVKSVTVGLQGEILQEGWV